VFTSRLRDMWAELTAKMLVSMPGNYSQGSESTRRGAASAR
jgi:hypothetical protein